MRFICYLLFFLVVHLFNTSEAKMILDIDHQEFVETGSFQVLNCIKGDQNGRCWFQFMNKEIQDVGFTPHPPIVDQVHYLNEKIVFMHQDQKLIAYNLSSERDCWNIDVAETHQIIEIKLGFLDERYFFVLNFFNPDELYSQISLLDVDDGRKLDDFKLSSKVPVSVRLMDSKQQNISDFLYLIDQDKLWRYDLTKKRLIERFQLLQGNHIQQLEITTHPEQYEQGLIYLVEKNNKTGVYSISLVTESWNDFSSSASLFKTINIPIQRLFIRNHRILVEINGTYQVFDKAFVLQKELAWEEIYASLVSSCTQSSLIQQELIYDQRQDIYSILCLYDEGKITVHQGRLDMGQFKLSAYLYHYQNKKA